MVLELLEDKFVVGDVQPFSWPKERTTQQV